LRAEGPTRIAPRAPRDAALLRDSSSHPASAASRIDRGEILVEGSRPKRSHRLAAGEQVTVEPPPEPPSGAAGTPPPPVRHEDEHVLVVSKPPGLVVHPGVGNPAGTLVQALAEAGYPLARAGGEDRPGIVHRLDRDTSGLLVVAKTDEAYHGLVAALKRRDVERAYTTLVEGTMPGESGAVDAPVGRHQRDRIRFVAKADGRPALTRWTVERVGTVAVPSGGDAEVSLLTCRLETGRTHQIRVHLSFAGHPVAGDADYGARKDLAAALGLERPFLHSGRLRFAHPVTGAEVAVDDPLPPDLLEAGRRAGVLPPEKAGGHSPTC
jgi:23S rRNA pseudouridine1911/1915/1917 synthase